MGTWFEFPCQKYGVELTQHHRAIYDTEATAYIFYKNGSTNEKTGVNNHLKL